MGIFASVRRTSRTIYKNTHCNIVLSKAQRLAAGYQPL